MNWIKLCRRKNISLFFWNSIYSDRVAFFYLQPWQSLERLSGSGNPFGPDPKLLVLQTINFYPSGFFPSFQMSELPFFFFFFDLPWKRRSRFCVLVLLGFDLGVVDPLAGCALEILPVCLHLVLQQHVNPATSSKEKRLELSKFHIYFM